MTKTKKIPLWIAIFININIVIGGGFFLSAHELFTTSGRLAPLLWIFCALLLLPLVLVLAQLSRLYPSAGGLYIYSKNTLGDFWGFLSGWGYFIGTLAGNALVLHAFSGMTKELGFTLPFTHLLSPLASQLIFDLIFLILFTVINLFNITILEKLNVGFTILKTIPIGLVLISMFFLFDTKNFYAAPIKVSGILPSMPIVLFAYLGIEACCAISHNISKGEKNSARAMLISLGIIMAIYTSVQFGLLGILGVKSANPFFEIVPRLTTNPLLIHWGNLVVKIAILSSYLGGFYGMFYANSWNLYAIAKEKKITFSNQLAKLNKYNTPWISIITQGFLIAILLAVAITSPSTLMTMSVFGVVIAYVLSALTYFMINKKNPKGILMGILAAIGCGTLLILSLNNLIQDGLQYAIPFIVILGSGIVLYEVQKRKVNLR